MALAATTVWEVQAGGSDTNGGGYVGTGTDYSQQPSAELELTNITCTGDTTLTDADANGSFTDAMIGNILYLSDGEWYQIMSKTDADNIVVDRAGPVDTSMTLRVGGALATPGGLGAVLASHGVAGMKAYIKSGTTYTLSNAIVNTSGGPFSSGVGNMATARLTIFGYEVTRADFDDCDSLGSTPIISAGAQTSVQMITIKGDYNNKQHRIINVTIDGNDGASNNGITSTSTYLTGLAYRCSVLNCVNGYTGTNKLRAVECYAEGCSNYGFNAVSAFGCEAFACTNGYYTNNPVVEGCVAHGCSNIGFNAGTATIHAFMKCTSYGNGSHGFTFSYDMSIISDCVSYGNGGYNYDTDSTSHELINCAAGDPASANTKHTLTMFPIIVLSNTVSDVFVDAASGDFRPTNTPGGGALLRAAGIGVYSQTSNNNNDIGAMQHADPEESSGTTGPTTGGLVQQWIK